jgi:hypothetical protein
MMRPSSKVKRKDVASEDQLIRDQAFILAPIKTSANPAMSTAAVAATGIYAVFSSSSVAWNEPIFATCCC